MKVISVPTYTYNFYHASITDEKMRVTFGNRISLMSLKPLKISVEKLADRMAADKYNELKGGDPMFLTVARAAKLDYIFTVEHPDGPEGHVYLAGAEGTRTQQGLRMESFASPMRILSQHQEHHEFENMAPVSLLRFTVSDKEKLDNTVEVDGVEMVDTALERALKIMDIDQMYGMPPTKDREALIKSHEGVRKFAAEAPDKVIGDNSDVFGLGTLLDKVMEKINNDMGTMDATKVRFTRSTITDFSDVAMVNEQGQLRNAVRLRLSHISQPTWNEADEEMKAAGYIGYWHFPEAAYGEPVKELEDEQHAVVAFSGFHDLKIAVKHMDAISPAGEFAMPLQVYVALMGKEPSETMDHLEADEFNRQHALPVDAIPRPTGAIAS